MGQILPKFWHGGKITGFWGAKRVAEVEAEWSKPQEAWARRRLLVVRLIAQHELTVAQIMRVAEVSR
ncbi:MAG: hypothetical protein EXS43_09390, partial [Opitutus sp.]|nr:hypothetical protein [Opitutus sp.]